MSRRMLHTQARSIRTLLFLLAVLCLAACAPAAKPRTAPLTPEALKEAEIQRDFAVQSLYERVERLNAIASPLLTANEPLCRQRCKSAQTVGLTAEYFTRKDDTEWFEAKSKRWGVAENTMVVTSVMAGGPAAKAGVQRGDVIEAVNHEGANLSGKKVRLTQVLDKLATKGPVVLQLRRAGQRMLVTIPKPVDVCDSRFIVVTGDVVNAYANGKMIFVTYGIMNLFAKDEDLAVVLGHELAHNVLEHIKKDSSGKRINASTPEAETEADAVGLYFTARAGFSIADAPKVWRQMAAQNPGQIKGGAVHPSSASRFVDLEAVRDEIMMRQTAGLPLFPKPRVGLGQ